MEAQLSMQVCYVFLLGCQTLQFLGYADSKEAMNEGEDDDDTEVLESHAWFSIYHQWDPTYGLLESFKLIAHILNTVGPIDGIMGFPQRGVVSTMVASLLEGKSRKDAFDIAKSALSSSIPFPSVFDGISHLPFKFVVSFASGIAKSAKYAGFYENPCIATPFCIFAGNMKVSWTVS